MIQIRRNRCLSIFVLAALGVGQASSQCAVFADSMAANAGWATPVVGKAKFAHGYMTFAQRSIEKTQLNLPQITKVAEIMADRYVAGGEITFLGNSQGVPPELSGRAGGFMHFSWDPKRNAAQKAKDMAIVGWERAPEPAELEQLKNLRAAGTYIVGFGPRGLPALAAYAPLCDVWFDTGLGADDRVVKLPELQKAGRGNLLVNMLNSWSLTGEFVSALTRRGLMPVMWKSFMYPDGHSWAESHSKMKYHTDYKIAPIAAGKLGRAFLKEIKANIERFESKQTEHIATAASLINAELAKGRKTPVAFMGHAPWTYVGKYEDTAWETNYDISYGEDAWNKFATDMPENALVVRLGYTGLPPEEAAAYQKKDLRVILISTINPDPKWKVPESEPLFIDMGWPYGDAAVSIPGYPIRILPPSGIMQLVAYESINVEVLGKLASK